MAVSVTNQLQVFLLSILGGVGAGLLFDLFRTFRRFVRSGTAWVGVQDLFFWLIFAIAAFVFLYYCNDGEPRWYIFCGMLLGAVLYHCAARNYVVSFLALLTKKILSVLVLICRILLFPFLVLYKGPILFFYRPIRRFCLFFSKKTHALAGEMLKKGKKIKKRLKMY